MSKRPGKERPCRGCMRLTRAATGMCWNCLHPGYVPLRPCLHCANPTRLDGRICDVCSYHLREAAKVSSDRDGIDPKGWVLDRRRRVMVWQPEIERAS